uniref:cobalamin B12-binding domain-containing protein n=1 Tax=Nonomuraea pusilla TaxID=46177 RepID=UPI0006E19ECA|nr:cobalamin-dependent protein [Nonomuraea pusilla]
MSGGRDLGRWADLLWAAATAGDEQAAVGVARDALDAGVDMEALLLDVVGAVQARVGAEWAANRISVTQEHVVTAVNERVIAALADHPGARRREGSARGRLAVACVDGEWHALPARLLAEVLRLRGWTVDYLGAQVPTQHLVSYLHRTGPDAIALSSSIATRLPAAHAAIAACRATGTPVLVGGAAYGPGGRYARLLGADAWAPDARAAADLLARGLPRRPPAPPQAAGRLPHLDDQEYTLLTRSSADLVRELMDELERRHPAVARYTPRQRQATAEDLAHVVEFLAASLYVDDPELFSGFLTWTASILTARDVPTGFLLSALDLLARRLTGLPRAAGVLAHAREVLCGGLVPAPVPGPGKPE